MGTFIPIILMVAGLAVAGETPAPQDEIVVADFETQNLALAPNPDNGQPPAWAKSSDNPRAGKSCLKLSYRNPTCGWGNLQAPVAMSGSEESLVLWLRRESAAKGALFCVWLFEDDGDGWMGPAVALETLGEGWQRVVLKISDFTYDPRGDKVRDIASVNKILLGGGRGDFVVYLDDVAFVGPDLERRRTEAMNVKVEIVPDAVACKSFLGFGAEWDPYYGLEMPEEHWALVVKRIRWMKLPIVRTMIQSKWCYRGEDRFDWDSAEMRRLYRHLDVCQKEGITVILTDWGCASRDASVNAWMKAPGLKGTDDPKYAEVIGTYLDRLIQNKGYSCIRYFILVNEPNWVAESWESWKKGVQNVAQAIKARGLDSKVTFVGSDYCQDAQDWHYRAVDQLSPLLGAYDLHRYARDAEVHGGQLEAYIRKQWDYALAKDPNAGKKPFIIAESGRQDGGFSAQGNQSIATYDYGLFMADYAVQAARAGSWALLAWMLDDSSHKGFGWGIWSDSASGLKLRPWFHPWSLLCRYVPPGSTVYRPKQSSDKVRVLAARAPGKDGGWTFCVVNPSRRPAKIALSVPDSEARAAVTLKRYLYSADSAKADDDGFPVPVATEQGDLRKGLDLECPARAAVFLTSL